MKNIKTLSPVLFVLLMILSSPSGVSAQDKKFNVGIQIGGFVPLEYQIQGLHQIDYSNGSPVSAAAGGFGNGSELNAYGEYDFSNWGIRLTSGIRMFDNTLAATLVPSGNTYSDKNTLGIVQVKLTLVDRLASRNSHFVPYLGMGVGILYARWEQEQFPEPGIPRT